MSQTDFGLLEFLCQILINEGQSLSIRRRKSNKYSQRHLYTSELSKIREYSYNKSWLVKNILTYDVFFWIVTGHDFKKKLEVTRQYLSQLDRLIMRAWKTQRPWPCNYFTHQRLSVPAVSDTKSIVPSSTALAWADEQTAIHVHFSNWRW